MNNTLIYSILALFAAINAHAVVVVDFNSSSGAVTSTSLNASTTGSVGGSWTVNSVVDSVYVNDGTGNIALQSDNKPTGGTERYDFDLTLNSSQSLAGTRISWDWEIVRVQNGNASGNRKNFFEVFDSSGNELFSIFNSNTSTDLGGQGIGLQDAANATTWLATGLGKGSADTYVPANMEEIEFILGASTFDVWINGSEVATSVTYNSAVTNLSRINLRGASADSGAQIDNINVIPESSSFALIAGLLGLSHIMARRRS